MKVNQLELFLYSILENLEDFIVIWNLLLAEKKNKLIVG